MLFFGIAAVIIILSIIFRIASALGLTIPLLYGLIAPTLFSGWFHANPVLAEGIGYGLLALVVLSWVISLIRKIADMVAQRREDKMAVELFVYRLREAKAQGIDTVSTEGLWR